MILLTLVLYDSLFEIVFLLEMQQFCLHIYMYMYIRDVVIDVIT